MSNVKCQKSKVLKKQQGITLLEVLLASSVALVVGAMLVLSLSNHTTLFYKQSSVVSEGLGLNDALGEINNNIRQASSAASGYPGVDPTYITSEDTLVLKLLSYDSSGILAETYDYVVIAPDPTLANVLRMQTFPSPNSLRPSGNRVLTNILKEITFSYLDKNGEVTVPSSAWQIGATLNIEAKTGSIGSERSSSILTTLRNN